MGGGGSDGGHTRLESNRTDREVSDTADNRSQGRGMVAMDGKKRQRPSESFAYKSIRNGADEYKWWIEEAIDAGTVEIMRGGAERQGESNSSNGNPLL